MTAEHAVEVSDVHNLQVQMSVFENDLASLHEDQPVSITVAALGNKAFAGKLSSINQIGKYDTSGSKLDVYKRQVVQLTRQHFFSFSHLVHLIFFFLLQQVTPQRSEHRRKAASVILILAHPGANEYGDPCCLQAVFCFTSPILDKYD